MKLRTLRILQKTVALVRTPQNTKLVFDISNLSWEGMPAAEKEKLHRDCEKDPNFMGLYRDRKALAAQFDISTLAKLPEGTLGRAYGEFMQARGLEPEFYDRRQGDGLIDFYAMRIRKTHDLWHVVTGFGTDPLGEIGLMAFCFGQKPMAFHAWVLLAGLFYSLVRGSLSTTQAMVDVIATGYRCGKSAQKLVGVRWEDLWQESLESVRRVYRVAEASPV